MLRLLAATLACLLFAGVEASAQPRTPAQHARAAWQALNAGKAQDAAAAFAEALEQSPRDVPLLFGAAAAAHMLGRSDEARRYLVDALRYDAAFTPASLLLGELLYRGDDLDGAINVYEQAAAHAPDHPQLKAKLEAWRKEAALHGRFDRKLADHFTVLFEGPAEAELAAKSLEILEAAYWRIGTALAAYPPEVITVVLYTGEQFRDITRSPSWAGGAYDGRIRVPVLGAMKNMAEFERVLAHELTHAIVKSLAPRGVPQWLNEGLAMNFEGRDLGPQLERVRTASERHSLSVLEGGFSGMDGAAAALAYAQSAAAVKLLLDEAGTPAVVGILTDLSRGLPFAEAFERHANMSYADFQRRF